MFIYIAIVAVVYFLCNVWDREYNERNREACNKEYRRKEIMEQKQEETAAHIKPITKRSASGCNWETYRNIVCKEESVSIKKKNNSAQKFSSTFPNHKKSYHGQASEMNDTIKEATNHNNIKIIMDENKKKITKEIAMDCEMVGIGDGTESMIARVSIVNKYGYCLYDKYVKPRERVQDYRTAVSGIYPHHLKNGEEFSLVQKEVADMLKGRILVGHALRNDLAVLFLSHPLRYIRDTSRYKTFRQVVHGGTPSLKRLASELLGTEIQVGEHNSIEDARVAMQLYMLYRNKWESELYSKKYKKENSLVL